MHSPSSLQSSLPLIPPWISFPDLEKADFIQTIVHQMWPALKEATETTILSVVTPLMEKLKPPFLTSLTFSKLDLGNIPPSIPGVKLQSGEDDEVMLDIEVEFAGNPNIVVEARSGPAPVTVHVADFFFRGTLRAVLKPLINEIPCFAAVSVSLVTKPEINFRLSTVGVSVMSLPGLNDFLYDLIKSQMAAFIVWPKRIVIPIKKLSEDVLSQLNTAESQGILYVKVKGAKDIKPGESYAKVSVGGQQKKKTESRKHTGAVEWREQFDFLIHDVDNDEVTIEVKSKENALMSTMNTLVINHIKSGAKSTALGDIVLPVNRVGTDEKANETVSMWLPLHHQHKGRTGQVHVELLWSPFIKEEEEGKGEEGSKQHELLRRRSTRRMVDGKTAGVMMITVHSASGLTKANGHAAHHAYVVLSLGEEKRKTGVAAGVTDGEDVSWNAAFEISVEHCQDAVLRLEVKEKTPHMSMSLGMGKDVVMGELTLPLAKLLKQGRKTETLPLQKSQGGTASICVTTEVKEV